MVNGKIVVMQRITRKCVTNRAHNCCITTILPLTILPSTPLPNCQYGTRLQRSHAQRREELPRLVGWIGLNKLPGLWEAVKEVIGHHTSVGFLNPDDPEYKGWSTEDAKLVCCGEKPKALFLYSGEADLVVTLEVYNENAQTHLEGPLSIKIRQSLYQWQNHRQLAVNEATFPYKAARFYQFVTISLSYEFVVSCNWKLLPKCQRSLLRCQSR